MSPACVMKEASPLRMSFAVKSAVFCELLMPMSPYASHVSGYVGPAAGLTVKLYAIDQP